MAGFAVEAEGEAGCCGRGPGGWRRLEKRGWRSELRVRAQGPERRRRVMLCGLGARRPFPRGKRRSLTPPFQPPFQGRVTPCPAPFLSSLGHRSDNPKRAHHNRAVSKAPSLGIRWWGVALWVEDETPVMCDAALS